MFMGGVVRSQAHRTELVVVLTTTKGVPPTSPRPRWIAVETTPSERMPLEKKERVNTQDWILQPQGVWEGKSGLPKHMA